MAILLSWLKYDAKPCPIKDNMDIKRDAQLISDKLLEYVFNPEEFNAVLNEEKNIRLLELLNAEAQANPVIGQELGPVQDVRFVNAEEAAKQAVANLVKSERNVEKLDNYEDIANYRDIVQCTWNKFKTRIASETKKISDMIDEILIKTFTKINCCSGLKI